VVGIQILVVRDPDGNEIYFNYPDAGEALAPGTNRAEPRAEEH
jgi:hypothetical protein